MMDLKQLAEPFPASDIEWRVGRSGMKDGEPWATVLAYVTNRAIMDRLDAVCGVGNWQNEFRPWTTGANGVMCGIAIRIDDEWVWKWDGAEQPKERNDGQPVAVKGGFSASMKRAAVQWGIGRYLYDVDEGFAVISQRGKHYQPGKKASGDKPAQPAFKWDPPALPAWALPSEAKNDGDRGNAGASPARANAPAGAARLSKQDAPSASAPTKVPEGMKLNGIRMATMSNEELEKLIAEKANDGRYAKHIAEAAKILASRTMEAKFAAEHEFQDGLPFVTAGETPT